MNQFDMKKQLIESFRDWITSEGMTQAEAARRMNIPATCVSEIMRNQCRYSAAWLLDQWVHMGGTAQLSLSPPPKSD